MKHATLRARLGVFRRCAKVLLRRRQLGVHAWLPGNPYSDLLYRQFRGVFTPQPMTMIEELDAFTRLPAGKRLLWIHSEANYSWGRSGNDLVAAHRSYLNSLQRWRHKNGKLVWTVHDDGLHLNDPDASRIHSIRSELRGMADCVHVHSEAAKVLVVERFGIDQSRIVVVPCPSYIPLYPKTPHQPEKLERVHRRLLCFGHVKAYKNYDALAVALDNLGPGSFERLTIAGPPSGDVVLPEASYRQNLDLDLQIHFVPDDQVPALFADANFQVLPYTESLTSSAATLSMGFGVPVIAPNLGGMRETVAEANWPLIYPPDEPDGLKNALRMARDMSVEDYRMLADQCRSFGEAIHPDRISGELVRILVQRSLLAV